MLRFVKLPPFKRILAAAALAISFGSQAFATQLLIDPGFEATTDNFSNPAWTLHYTDTGELSGESGIFANFSTAAHSGDWGVWFRSYLGEPTLPVDASVEQQVAALAGAHYDLAAYFKLEPNFTASDLILSLTFLDAADNPLEELVVSVLAADPKDSVWRLYSVSAVAPVGTVAAVVRAAMIGGLDAPFNPQSALLDDFSLIETATPVPLPAGLPLFLCGAAMLVSVGRTKSRSVFLKPRKMTWLRRSPPLTC